MKKAMVLLTLAGLLAGTAHAQSGISDEQSKVLKQLLDNYAAQAKQEVDQKNARGAISDKPFSAEVGREFFFKRRTWQSRNYTCTSCHTEDPSKEGRHMETKQPIKPLAPSANPKRFTDVAKVERNFTVHCTDLHDRDCTAFEKGNVIAYLMSVK